MVDPKNGLRLLKHAIGYSHRSHVDTNATQMKLITSFPETMMLFGPSATGIMLMRLKTEGHSEAPIQEAEAAVDYSETEEAGVEA